MKRSTGRRTVLIAAGTAVAAAAAGPAVAQPADFSGTIVFRGGAPIPKGRLEIYLEDPAVRDKAKQRTAETRIESDGNSKQVAFSLAPPAGLAASPTLRIVARLEREDGWLLARGSAQAGAGTPAEITLNTVMY